MGRSRISSAGIAGHPAGVKLLGREERGRRGFSVAARVRLLQDRLAIFVLEPDPRQKISPNPVVRGEPPDPANPPPGCRFHPRCPEALDVCRQDEPVLKKEVGEGHLVACHLS